jgi:hypothetical protein
VGEFVSWQGYRERSHYGSVLYSGRVLRRVLCWLPLWTAVVLEGQVGGLGLGPVRSLVHRGSARSYAAGGVADPFHCRVLQKQRHIQSDVSYRSGMIRLRDASSRTACDEDRGVPRKHRPPADVLRIREEQRRVQADPSPPFANNATGFGMTPMGEG